jgi:hypothetical protein
MQKFRGLLTVFFEAVSYTPGGEYSRVDSQRHERSLLRTTHNPIVYSTSSTSNLSLPTEEHVTPGRRPYGLAFASSSVGLDKMGPTCGPAVSIRGLCSLERTALDRGRSLWMCAVVFQWMKRARGFLRDHPICQWSARQWLTGRISGIKEGVYSIPDKV